MWLRNKIKRFSSTVTYFDGVFSVPSLLFQLCQSYFVTLKELAADFSVNIHCETASNNVLITGKAKFIFAVLDHPTQASFKLSFMLHRNDRKIRGEWQESTEFSFMVTGYSMHILERTFLLEACELPWLYLEIFYGGLNLSCHRLYNLLLHHRDQWALAAPGFDLHYSSSDLRFLSDFKPARRECQGERLIEVSRWQVCCDLCGDKQCNYTAGQKEHYSS